MTDRASPLPVTVLTGFLGSGKTTLLNRLLASPGLSDTAVVINELGEIGIDHLLVTEARDNVLLLESGCLCCAITDSLGETLADLYRRRGAGSVPPFTRAVVETTGLADPTPILRALMRDPLIQGLYVPAGVLCTVDAIHGVGQMDRHGEARAQIALADRIVVTKTDHPRADTCALLPRLNALSLNVPIILGVPDDALPALVENAGRSAIPPHGDGVRHDTHVGSVALRVSAPVTQSGLGAWIAALRLKFGSRLLRCKAILARADRTEPVVVHGVQTIFETSILSDWPDADHDGRIVCIAQDIDPEWLRASLSLLTLSEGTLPPSRVEDIRF